MPDDTASLPVSAEQLPSIAEVAGGDLPVSLRIMIDDQLFQRVQTIAAFMAKDQAFTPRHLQGKPEACFSVITMALDWKLNPQFVARNTYQTPGGSIGFMGALVHGILEKSGRFIGAPKYEFRGNWQSLNGKFKIATSQKGGEYAVPTWTAADAVGLGIIVRWQVRGEPEPRCWPGEDEPFWLTQCYPLNSPLWATDPKSQIQYLVIRRFANMAAPGILGGAAFDHEDLLDASERARDVTPGAGLYTAAHADPAVETERTEPAFGVVDNDGEIIKFSTPAMVQRALMTVFEDAAKRNARKGLQAALENNASIIGDISGVEPEIGSEIRSAYQEMIARLADQDAGEHTDEDPAPDPPTTQAQSTPSSAGPGPVSGHLAWSTQHPAGDQPTRGAAKRSFFDQDDLELPPVMKNGKPDWATWATGVFLPKAGTARDAADLARLIGANDPHLEAYYNTYPKNKAHLQGAIAATYRRLEGQTSSGVQDA